MLETAQSFYKMAKIKVNSDKSVLATNENLKTTPNQTINFEQQNIQAIKQNTPFRFLGCWFTINNKQVAIQKIIENEIGDALQLLKKAIITEKQTIYIINMVVLTRFEYRSQNFILGENKCEK